MAGGAGERFWPFSRQVRPKQLLPITGKKSMLSESIEKIADLIPKDDCYIVTNALLKKAILEDVKEFPESNIFCEPLGRNTAPCLAFASAILSKKFDDCLVAVLTADHLIKNDKAYLKNINLALRTAENEEVLVTFGIPPNRPETGYGYIQIDKWIKKTSLGWVAKVKRFHEKPNLETAKKYLKSRSFYWNSGMFFWRNSVILSAFKKFSPPLFNGIQGIKEALDTPQKTQVIKETFENFENISIDVAIMEKFPQIRMIKADFEWDDIGCWKSLERIGKKDKDGNTLIGNVLAIDTKNTIAFAESSKTKSMQPLVALLGVEDYVVVTSGECILVCPKDRVQDVKKIITELKKSNRIENI